MPMLAESWPPCRVIDRAQHPLTTAIPDTEGSTKLFMLYFQEVAGRILCQITGGTDKTYSWGLGLLVFTSRTTTKFIILSTKTNPETSPSQEGESTICTVQYNTTILGDIGTLSCLLQSPG